MDASLHSDPLNQQVFIKLEGLADSVKDRRILSQPLLSGMRLIQKSAKAGAPRDTGFLRSQIIAWTNTRKTDAPLSGFVTVATRAKRTRSGQMKNARLSARRSAGRKVAVITAYYGRFQEKGTSKMSAHPYLSRAVDDVGYDAIAQVAKEAGGAMVKLLESKL